MENGPYACVLLVGCRDGVAVCSHNFEACFLDMAGFVPKFKNKPEAMVGWFFSEVQEGQHSLHEALRVALGMKWPKEVTYTCPIDRAKHAAGGCADPSVRCAYCEQTGAITGTAEETATSNGGAAKSSGKPAHDGAIKHTVPLKIMAISDMVSVVRHACTCESIRGAGHHHHCDTTTMAPTAAHTAFVNATKPNDICLPAASRRHCCTCWACPRAVALAAEKPSPLP